MSVYQRKLFEHIASAAAARLNCLEFEKRDGKPHEWTAKHEEKIERLTLDFLPSGSGIDSAIEFDFEKSHGEKLVFHFSYHHMNEGGFYDGWTDHTLTVTPSLTSGINLDISGRNRNQVKEYFHDIFHGALTDLIDYDKTEEKYFSISMRAAAQAFKAQEDKLGN